MTMFEWQFRRFLNARMYSFTAGTSNHQINILFIIQDIAVWRKLALVKKDFELVPCYKMLYDTGNLPGEVFAILLNQSVHVTLKFDTQWQLNMFSFVDSARNFESGNVPFKGFKIIEKYTQESFPGMTSQISHNAIYICET